jgi:hypothetical protein
MKKLVLISLSVLSVFISCKKNSSTSSLVGKGFIVSQAATCNGDGTYEISNMDVGDLYITFDSPTFTPAPNTWYRASNPGAPCGSCSLLFRYKTGSDVSPKDALVTFDADTKAYTLTNLCK